MIKDILMSRQTWHDAWHWYRSAPHQQQAIDLLFDHITELPGGACLLTEEAEWFQAYRVREKLIHDFMHPEGH
jgi:hypothetical protein